MSEFPQKKTWSTLKTFTEEGSNLAVEVQASNDERPILSWRDGRMHEGRFVHGHRPRGRAEGGVVNLERTNLDVLARLVTGAENYILERRQQQENEFQANRRNQSDRKQLGNRPKHKGGNSHGRGGRDGNWDFDR